MNVRDLKFYLVCNCVVQKEFYVEILKNLLACYPDDRITSGPLFADHDGAANVDATLVQRLHHAIPSTRLSSSACQAITGTRSWSSIGHVFAMTIFLVSAFVPFRMYLCIY